ncbi:FAD-dependent monooxygenase [Streptomyces sp. HD1123-B1]|uniref:FAD-dependent monooxygenase n=1 Tax=Streptomyces huangiella TaxID=3228804 RepID=UPI003D7CA51F
MGRDADPPAEPPALRRLHLRGAPYRHPRPVRSHSQPHRAGRLDFHPQQGPRRLPVVGSTRPPHRHARAHGPPRCCDAARRPLPRPPAVPDRRHRPPARPELAHPRPQAPQAVVPGRITVIGDAAHPTSPYAAHGAGMATEDGYFLGRRLAGRDLTDHTTVAEALQAFETPRKPHTSRQSQTA